MNSDSTLTLQDRLYSNTVLNTQSTYKSEYKTPLATCITHIRDKTRNGSCNDDRGSKFVWEMVVERGLSLGLLPFTVFIMEDIFRGREE